MNRRNGSAALFDLSGEVSNNATWNEPIYFRVGDYPLPLSGLAFQLQFTKPDDSTSIVLKLTTADSQMALEEDEGGEETILRINVPYSTISGLCGEYAGDLVAKDSDGNLTHWASGFVTFRQSPIAF